MHQPQEIGEFCEKTTPRGVKKLCVCCHRTTGYLVSGFGSSKRRCLNGTKAHSPQSTEATYRRNRRMNTGKEEPAIVVEPAQEPVRQPERQPAPVETPAKDPVPA